MTNRIKQICSVVLTVVITAGMFSGCAKKVRPAENTGGGNDNGQDSVWQDSTAETALSSADTAGISGNGSPAGGSVGSGGGSPGGFSGYSAGESGGGYTGGTPGGSAYPNGGNGSLQDNSMPSEETTTSIPHDVVRGDAVALLNSAPLRPTLTNDEDLDTRIENLLGQVTTPSMSTYEKVVAVHNYFIANARYGFLLDKNPSVTYLSIYDRQVVASSKAFLRSWTGTCYDFASAFMAICRRIGLECYKVKGDFIFDNGTTSNHGWNIIRLKGIDYIFDVEADWRASKPENGEYAFPYFCVSKHWRFDTSNYKLYVGSYAGFKTADFTSITLPANDIPEE